MNPGHEKIKNVLFGDIRQEIRILVDCVARQTSQLAAFAAKLKSLRL